jgi:hypothetical protein
MSMPPTRSAFRRRIEAANQVQQGRLAGTGRTHEREEPSVCDVHVHALQDVDPFCAAPECFVDVVSSNQTSVFISHYFDAAVSSAEATPPHGRLAESREDFNAVAVGVAQPDCTALDAVPAHDEGEVVPPSVLIVALGVRSSTARRPWPIPPRHAGTTL